MSAPAETFELRLAADLGAVREAARRIGVHLRLRGLGGSMWEGIELAVVEAMTNAVTHGCAGAADAAVTVRVQWEGTGMRVEVRDPGRFTPGPRWGELPSDPLATSGRGGFIMRQVFAEVEHTNDDRGHVLSLYRLLPTAPADPELALGAADMAAGFAHDLETAYEATAGLRHFASLLASTSNLEELLQHTLLRLQELTAFEFGVVRVEQVGGLRLAGGRGRLPQLPALVALAGGSVEAAVHASGMRREVADRATLPADDPLRAAGGPVLVVPIGYEVRRIGTLAVARLPAEPFFSAGQVELVHTVAEFLGIAYATGEMQAREREMEMTRHDLTIAAEMQRRLLPTAFPQRRDVRLAGQCLSAQAVGGDYFDAIDLGTGGILLVIADVMGKGLPAALVATVLRSAIRAREEMGADPGRLLTAVNRQLTGDLLALDIFITALLGYVPPGAAEIRLASAGHCPLFLRRTGGAVHRIEGKGCPLGVFGSFEYETVAVPLRPGDIALFLTDGLFEAERGAEGQIGLAGLERALGAAPAGADAVVRHLMDLSAPTAGRPAFDDRTVLALERLP